MSKNFEIYESNMWQVYLYIIVFTILAIFLNTLFSGILVLEDGWIVFLILNSPFIFLVAPCILYFYLNHGRKRIFISNLTLEINTPLRSKRTIGWNEFDTIKLYARGPHKDIIHYAWGRDYTKFKISFIKDSNNRPTRTINFRFYKRNNATRIISILTFSANENEKEIEVDRKYI